MVLNRLLGFVLVEPLGLKYCLRIRYSNECDTQSKHDCAWIHRSKLSILQKPNLIAQYRVLACMDGIFGSNVKVNSE